MNLATWSIRNPIPAILLFVLLTLAGLWGFRALPIQAPAAALPGIRLATVVCPSPGTAVGVDMVVPSVWNRDE